jgi:hypothetical protein
MENSMTRPYPSALATSRAVVRMLIFLNWLLGGLVLALFLASLIAGRAVFSGLGADPGDARMVAAMRIIMVIGMASTPIAAVLLTRLRAIIESVRLGDPFVASNAVRLQTTAWALLGLELLHLAVGAAAAWGSSKAHPLDINWNFSLTGWLGVLLLFVLARVFEHGARMRDDLAGTV